MEVFYTLSRRGDARFRFGYTISFLKQERMTKFGNIKRLELGVK
jgi:hypothetical protein